MKRFLLAITILLIGTWHYGPLLLGAFLGAQQQPPVAYQPQLISYNGVPFGPCDIYQVALNTTNGTYYSCAPNTRTWTVAGSSAQTAVTCASSITFNPGGAFLTDYFLNLNCNVATSTMGAGFSAGQEAVFTIVQDNVGAHTFAWPTTFLNTPTVQSGANATTVATFQFCGTVGNGNACPANDWQNTDVGPASSGPGFLNNIVDPVNSYGAKFDGVLYYDVTATSPSPTVTCPNSDCAFTSAMVGRQAWVVNNNGCNGTSQCTPIIGTVGSAPPTVVSVGGANSITLSVNASGSCTATCAIIVADDDTTALTNAYNAAATKCGTLQMPAGITIVNSALFNEYPATNACTIFSAPGSRQMTTVKGYGASATILVPSINFNMASCTVTFGAGQPGGACFGTVVSTAHGTTLEGFTIYGMGLNMGSSANNKVGIAVGTIGENYTIKDVELMHWNAGSTGSWGLYVNGGTTILNNVQVDGFNNTPCVFGGSNLMISGQYFCGDSPGPGLNLVSASSFITTYGGQYCSTGNPVVQLAASVIWNSFGEQFEPSVCGSVANQKFINGGATMTVSLVGDSILGAGTSDIGVSFSGGSVSMLDTSFIENGTTASCFNTAGTPTFINLGGNTLTCTTLLTGGSAGLSIIADGHSVKGACTGVATAASTLGLYGTGPNETLTTCTSTTIGSGIVVSGVRTLYGLVATASAGGVNASSGVVTVLKNGSATTITCTLGTGTICNDGTHSVTTADGDLISLQFTTQSADTLANVKAVISW